MSEIRLPDALTPRDVVAVIFRHIGAVLACFALIVVTVGTYSFFWPPTYEATVRVLVKKDRQEPLVTADQEAVRTISHSDVTETDLNSEAAIIQSVAVLEQTVKDLHLDQLPQHWIIRLLNWPIERSTAVYNAYHGKPAQTGIGRATARLARRLIVEPEKKSGIILVRLRWGDPQMAERILERLSQNYRAQHGAVRRAPDTEAFFRGQIDVKKAELAEIDRQIAQIRPGATLASLGAERDLVAKQAAEFEAEWRKAHALQAQVRARIESMAQELQPLPEQVVLENRDVLAAQALDTLKARVLDLRLRRTQLLQEFQPTHRQVQQVEQQLRQAEDMLAKEESRPYRESTMGRNQIADTLRQDVMVNRAQLSSLAALEAATARQQKAFGAEALHLDTQVDRLRGLERSRAAATDALLEYLRRSEEARINDEMHRTGFVDVSFIEPVRSGSSPVKPNVPLLMKLTLGLAPIVSLALAFLLDIVDHRIKSDRELEMAVGVPVLGVVDRQSTTERLGRVAWSR